MADEPDVLDALGATGLASGWNFNKAEAILRSMGATIEDFVPITSTAGKVFGGAAGAIMNQ